MRARDPHNEPLSERPGAEPADDRQLARARVGRTIQKKWRLDGLMGTGGMAAVYAATHRNGSRAALKIMHRELSADPVLRQRFLREGYVSNKVDHPGRVAIIDDDVTENDEPFLVMELLEGETVQQIWKRKNRKLDVNEALWIAGEVLGALSAFHAQGILHRDLKPANVFLTKERQVKIIDYGVARLQNSGSVQTMAGTALGTPSFMAPEQAQGTADVDGRADVFSIGAMLYALLSGQRLHQGRTDNEAFILAATSPAPSLARAAPHLPVDVIALVDKALAWDKRNRFETPEAMRHQVAALLDKHGGPPAPSSSLQRPGRTTRAPEPNTIATTTPVEVEKAAANDPAVLRLVEVFRRLDRVLPAMHHYGKLHPESETKVQATHQAVLEALRADPESAFVTLAPYAFEHRGQTIWEPVGLFDAVPYHLFAAGVRRITFETGITADELRSLCEVLLLDPNRDLLPEDDMAAALWERQLGHIKCEVIAIFAEGDAVDREAFFVESDELEEAARRAAEERANNAEAMAMAVASDMSAVRDARQAASAFALDPAAKAALGAQLGQSYERWTERYVDALADAVLRARAEGRLGLCADPLAESTRDLLLGRRPETALSMWETLLRALDVRAPNDASLGPDLTRTMFGPEALRLLLKEVSRRPGEGPPSSAPPSSGGTPSSGLPAQPSGLSGPASVRSSSVSMLPPPSSMSSAALAAGGHGSPGYSPSGGPSSSFTPASSSFQPPASRGPMGAELLRVAELIPNVLDSLDGACVEVAVAALVEVAHDGVRRALYAYIERAMAGHEERVAELMWAFDPETARPILRALAGSRREEATSALGRLKVAKSPALRCEAVAHAARSPDELRDELMKLAEDPSPEMRSAALRALAAHKVRAAGPLLIKRASDPSFQGVPAAEQREILDALFALHPVRAEALAIDLVQKHGLMSDEALDVTRTACADLLGREARSEEALAAVLEAGKRRWWNGQGLRDAASRAAERIAVRLGKRVSPQGEPV